MTFDEAIAKADEALQKALGNGHPDAINKCVNVADRYIDIARAISVNQAQR